MQKIYSEDPKEVEKAISDVIRDEERKNRIFKVVFTSVVLILIVMLAFLWLYTFEARHNKSSVVEESVPSTSSQKENETVLDEEREALPGTVVRTNELKITYLSCSDNYKNYNEMFPPKDGYKIIMAKFEFENISNTDRAIWGSECYADDMKCDLYLYAKDSSWAAIDTISPGRKVQAAVYYEVPKDAKKIEIEFDGNVWINEKIIFVVE